MTPEPYYLSIRHPAPDGHIFAPGCFTLGAPATINLGAPFDGRAILRGCDVAEDGKEVVLTFEIVQEKENEHG